MMELPDEPQLPSVSFPISESLLAPLVPGTSLADLTSVNSHVNDIMCAVMRVYLFFWCRVQIRVLSSGSVVADAPTATVLLL